MSLRPRSLCRVTPLLFAATALAAAAPVAPVAAADAPPPEPVTIAVVLDGPCVSGAAPDGPISITVKRMGAKNQVIDESASSGFYQACGTRRIRAGDVITAVSGDITRTVTVPRVEGFLDRDTDRLSGRVGKGTLKAVLFLCPGPICVVPQVTIPVKADGTYSRNLAADGVFGSADVTLDLERTTGDRFSRDVASATLRAPGNKPGTVDVVVPRSGLVTVTVKNAVGKVKGIGTATLRADRDFQSVTIRKNGAKVTLAPGDRVSTSMSPDAVVKLPASLTASATATEDVVHATCFPNRPYSVEIVNQNASGSDIAGPAGEVAYGAYDLNAGDTLLVTCYTAKGDQVQLTGTVS